MNRLALLVRELCDLGAGLLYWLMPEFSRERDVRERYHDLTRAWECREVAIEKARAEIARQREIKRRLAQKLAECRKSLQEDLLVVGPTASLAAYVVRYEGECIGIVQLSEEGCHVDVADGFEGPMPERAAVREILERHIVGPLVEKVITARERCTR